MTCYGAGSDAFGNVAKHHRRGTVKREGRVLTKEIADIGKNKHLQQSCQSRQRSRGRAAAEGADKYYWGQEGPYGGEEAMADEDNEKVLLGQGPGLAHQCHDGIPTGAEARRGQLLSYREIGQGSGARFMRRRAGLGIRSVAREGRDSRRRRVINAEPPLNSCREEKRKSAIEEGKKERSVSVRLYRKEIHDCQ